VFFSPRVQFPKLNPIPPSWQGPLPSQGYFSRDGGCKYFISGLMTTDREGQGSNFVVSNDMGYRVGDLVWMLDSEAWFFEIEIIFYLDNHLYYMPVAERRISSIFPHSARYYRKFGFFRFCLNTGENQRLTLQTFFNRFEPVFYQTTGNRVYLNPDFRVRR